MKEHIIQPMRLRWATYLGAFALTVLLALILLIGCALLPQELICEHLADSVGTVERDTRDQYIFDRSAASKADVGTDVLMLQASISTNNRYLGAVLTNPIYTYSDLPDWEDLHEVIARQAYDIPHDGVWLYARYWMGFRVILRLALTLFNYAQIKRYLAVIFFNLFALVMTSVAKHSNLRNGFLFALSVILVRPHVIASSMQFTCCFLIAFAAMLLIPWLYRHPRYEGLFFMEVGMVTMYFDFYTVPLITFGFPMLYLCLLRLEGGERISVRAVLKRFAAWAAGYGLMWIAKLTLTSLLTSVNGLAQGLSSFAVRVGIKKEAHLEKYNSVKAALDALGEAIFSDQTGKIVYLLMLALVVIVVLVQIGKKHVALAHMRRGLPLMFLAAMPFIWFLVTIQPVAIHAYFQYRSIVLTYWGVGIYVQYLLGTRPVKKLESPLEQET